MAETLRELVVALSLDSSKVFTLISLRKQQIAKLEELVKARFVEMFGDPVKNPKKWATKCFDDVCDGIGDGLHGTPEYDDNGDYPFINGNNLIDGHIVITPATKKVSADTYKQHFIEISSNAILISINGTLGKLAYYNDEKVMLGTREAMPCPLMRELRGWVLPGGRASPRFPSPAVRKLRFFLQKCKKTLYKTSKRAIIP